MSHREREDRALEALIVSNLRPDKECLDPEKLPRLTDEERASLKSFRPGFIKELISEVDAEAGEPVESVLPEEAEHLELAYGMNRAEEIDEATDEELNRRRQELLDELGKEKEDDAERDRGTG